MPNDLQTMDDRKKQTLLQDLGQPAASSEQGHKDRLSEMWGEQKKRAEKASREQKPKYSVK